ncbi:hypothetical protein BH09ACT10_BH09ACT10_26600 [soil metagenome]
MGLLKTAAKVAVASSVHGRVQRRQQDRWAEQDAAAAPPAPAAGFDAVLEQLTKLGELRSAGVLTDAEFEAQKARILALPVD